MRRQYCIKEEFTNRKSPEANGVADRALGITQNAALAARIQAPILPPHVVLPPSENLWAEAVHWACEPLNRTATTSNPGNKSPHEMWYGEAAPASPHPSLRPGYCRWNRPSKSFPRCESSFYLGPCIDHPRDSLPMLTRANKVVDTRDVIWATPPVMVPPVQLQQPGSPELGGRRSWEVRQSRGGIGVEKDARAGRARLLRFWSTDSIATAGERDPPSASSDTPGGE